MSPQPKTYEEAKARHKPLSRKKQLRGRPIERKRSAPKPRKRMKRHRVSPAELAWREGVLDRAGNRCQWVDQQTGKRCEVRGKENLDAHHINERSQRPDLILEPTNGAALCGGPSRHHDRAHHTEQGRKDARAQQLLGGESYEAAQKRKRDAT